MHGQPFSTELFGGTRGDRHGEGAPAATGPRAVRRHVLAEVTPGGDETKNGELRVGEVTATTARAAVSMPECFHPRTCEPYLRRRALMGP